MNHPRQLPNSLTPYQSVELPFRTPLLSRIGWSFFMLALIAVCAVAPLLNLWLPQDSPYHMSTYAVALLGKIMCYAICALAMDLIWGLHRHFVAGPRFVFCHRWLCHGHVPHAPDRSGRQLQKHFARLHGLS